MEDVKVVLPFIITITAMIIGFVYQHFGVIMKLKEDNSKTLLDLSTRITTVETKIELFWRCVEGKMVEILKSYPTNLLKDVLLDKFREKSLNLGEAEQLRTILDCELVNSSGKKFAYIMILGRLEQVIYNLRGNENE
jgi:hypothetical protein